MPSYYSCQIRNLDQPQQLLSHCCTPEWLSYHTHSFTLGPDRSDAWLQWMARLSLAAWGAPLPQWRLVSLSTTKKWLLCALRVTTFGQEKKVQWRAVDLSGQNNLCKTLWLYNLLINPLTLELITERRGVALGDPSSRSASYLKGQTLKFLPKYRLSWLTCLMVFHSASKQMMS